MLHPFFHDLNPPSVKLDSDLDFVLRVAFGAGLEGARCTSSDGAWSWAERLGLEQQCAQQLEPERAREWLGPAALRRLDGIRAQAQLARDAREQAWQRLCGAVQSSGVEAVWLGALANAPHAQSRWCESNIDVLVRGDDVRGLATALVVSGCTTETTRVMRLARPGEGPVFLGSCGAVFVLHTELRFLRMVPGGVFIDKDCLKRCGQLRFDENAPQGFIALSKAVQAADVTAQWLVEQRFAVDSSSFCALLGAHELKLGDDEDLAFDAYIMLQTDVEHAEFEAFRELLRALRDGKLSSLSKRARTLLNHALAMKVNPGYRARLKLQHKAQVWQQEGHLERAAEKVGRFLGKWSRH